MDILRIRNEKGEWVGIPAIKGENAYEIAVAHGYEGTQEEWLASLKGAKGDIGESTKIYPFPFVGFGVGHESAMPVYWWEYEGDDAPRKEDYPDADDWKVGDILMSENGKMMLIINIVKFSEYKWSIGIRCFADIMGKTGEAGKDGNSVVVDESYNPDSANAISGRAVAEVMSAIEFYKANSDLSNVDDYIFRAKAAAAGVGGDAGIAGNGGSALKRIGFTEDCDYIATSSDGYSAFSQAVADAGDGDTIVVLAGTYSGSYTLQISKNITFIGVGKPTIAFPITIGTNSQAYTVKFDNLQFSRAITCGRVDEYTSSKIEAYNSRFYDSTITVVGTFNSCAIDYSNVSCSLSYYGDSSLCSIHYYDCDIANSTMNGDSAILKKCIIRECSTPQGYDVYYTDCLLYNFKNKMRTAYQTYLERCVMYGNRFPESDMGANYYECCFVAGESI